MNWIRRMSVLDRWLIAAAFVGSLAVFVGLKLHLPHALRGEWVEAAKPISEERLTAWRGIKAHLQSAEEEDAKAWRRNAQRIHKFFHERAGKEGAFAEELVSFESKFRLIDSKIDVRRTLGGMIDDVRRLLGDDSDESYQLMAIEDSFDSYVEKCFCSILFAPADLEAAVESSIAAYLAESNAVENRLLVKVQADIGNVVLPDSGPRPPSERMFRAAFDEVSRRVMPDVTRDLPVTVGKEVVTTVAQNLIQPLVMQVLGTVAAELGLSGGIFSSSVMTSGATLGVSVIMGILLDRLATALLKEAGYDPEKEIAAKVKTAVDKVHALLADALTKQLESLHRARCRVRMETLRTLILEGGNP